MAPSRGLRILSEIHSLLYICSRRQARKFATNGPLLSGHSRWSKIKHDKGKADAVVNKVRSVFAKEIMTASKIYGPDPNLNPRLADQITKAKKAGFPKASIEAAIARGQGRSLTGASLENVTVEGLLPNNIAVIVECETDKKARTLTEVKRVIKAHGGNATPTTYLFTKKGKIVYEGKDGIGMDEALDSALEAGALDVEEDEEHRVVVFTEPDETKAVSEAVAKALEMQIATSDILWDPNVDTRVTIPDEAALEETIKFLEALREADAGVQSIAMNVIQGDMDDEAWDAVQSRLNDS